MQIVPPAVAIFYLFIYLFYFILVFFFLMVLINLLFRSRRIPQFFFRLSSRFAKHPLLKLHRVNRTEKEYTVYVSVSVNCMFVYIYYIRLDIYAVHTCIYIHIY